MLSNIAGIIGGKFGLYGHLPALLYKYGTVALSIKNQEFVRTRLDLKKYYDRIVWLKDDQEVLAQSSLLVLAVPPLAQEEIIFNNIELLTSKKLILEKPLSDNPKSAQVLLKNLIKYKINFRVNYTFFVTEWFYEICSLLYSNQHYEIVIKWEFLAHHFKEPSHIWKKYHSKGGGCLRFFSIHLIALLAHLKFKKIKSSQLFYVDTDIPYKWFAQLNDNKNRAIICVDSKATNNFFHVTVIQNKKTIYEKHIDSPFEENKNKMFSDIRSVYILEILSQLDKDNLPFMKQYLEINQLWSHIEKFSDHKLNA